MNRVWRLVTVMTTLLVDREKHAHQAHQAQQAEDRAQRAKDRDKLPAITFAETSARPRASHYVAR